MYLKLKFLQGNSTTSVRSASQFLLDLRGRRIQSDEIMVSFDVTSLFTFIPPNLAREVLHKRLEEAYDETQNALKTEHLMRLFEFCQQTFFTFAGETYEQIKGTPMGSTVSGFVVELVLQELEKLAFIQHEPVLWRRYVDDTFAIVKKDMLQHFHSLLNAVFPDIKFTREEEQEQQLPFLDVFVRRNPNGKLETTVYRKATNTTQLLSFHSNHPVAHKRSCVKTLFNRVQTHCSKPEDRAHEARYLRDQFVQNGYPRAFISRCLRGRHQRTRTSTPPTIWHSLSYIKGVSEATERIAAELGVGIAHRPKATMRNRYGDFSVTQLVRLKSRSETFAFANQLQPPKRIDQSSSPRFLTGRSSITVDSYRKYIRCNPIFMYSDKPPDCILLSCAKPMVGVEFCF
ncbi:hypothetical protein SprV_0702422500 [Sparganum proliferum]